MSMPDSKHQIIALSNLKIEQEIFFTLPVLLYH